MEQVQTVGSPGWASLARDTLVGGGWDYSWDWLMLPQFRGKAALGLPWWACWSSRMGLGHGEFWGHATQGPDL